MTDRFATTATNNFAGEAFPADDNPAPGMHRRTLLKSIGVGGLALAGAGVVSKGFGIPALLDGATDAASATPTSCTPASRIADARVVSGNLFSALGLNGPDVLSTADGGGSFINTKADAAGGAFVPYTTGTNGVPGWLGIAGDNGRVMIYDPNAKTWRNSKPGGSSIITGLAGNGSFWVATATEGKFWYSWDNGANWSSPSNGSYLNYKSIASILSVYDLEYANGVWVGCGYDTLGVGRTFWRSTTPYPTRGAKNSWFSVSGGDFGETIASGDGNAVSVYAVAYAGSCAGNTWYGAGNFGTVWRSTDNGGSWSKFRDSGSQIHYGIDVNPYTGKVICASGIEGIIEVNPGMVQRYSPGSKEIYEVAWVGGNDWLAAGDNGQVLVSHNDGVTWTQTVMPSGTGGTLYNCIAKPW